MTILIVEDDKPLRETFADVLRQVGYRVAAAENGREALDRIRVERPTFIFVDLVMPVMSGFELIEALKADHDLSTIPIVAMTASGAAAAPGAMLVKKPFRAEAAVKLIEMHSGCAKGRIDSMDPNEELDPRERLGYRGETRMQRKCRQRVPRSRRTLPKG
jgi:CheY-like chemotaxis protein